MSWCNVAPAEHETDFPNLATTMYATQLNVTTEPPVTHPDAFVGRFLTYPTGSGDRIAEGGLRLSGGYKKTSAERPLVSVITTVLDRDKTLERALCSVLSQTYSNIEYIVIDGGSTDNTLAVLEKYVDAVDYYVSEPDSGIYAGMNKGLELAQGDFLLLLNSDDWYMPNCIELLVEEVRSKNLDFTSALAIEADEFGQEIRPIPKIPIEGIVRFRMPLRHETMLVSRELYNQVGPYDDSYRLIADLKLTQDLHEATSAWSQMEQYVMVFRKTGAAAAATPELIGERRRLMAERFAFLSDEEIAMLCEDKIADPAPYVAAAERHRGETRFIEAMTAFLQLHGVFREYPELGKNPVFATD